MCEIFHWFCSFPFQSCLQKALEIYPALETAFIVVTFAYSQHPSSTQTASPWSQRGHLIISKRQVCSKDLLTGEEKRLWKCAPAALLKCPFGVHFSWLRGALARPWILPQDPGLPQTEVQHSWKSSLRSQNSSALLLFKPTCQLAVNEDSLKWSENNRSFLTVHPRAVQQQQFCINEGLGCSWDSCLGAQESQL